MEDIIYKMSIPKKIFSIWLSEERIFPTLIDKCIKSQQEYCSRNGYEYELITLDNCYKDFKYMQECLNSTHRPGIKYCKASDYLRMYYLKNFGGIYLDSDVEMLQEGPGFDHLLEHRMFIGEEGCETIPGSIVLGSAVIGAEANHPFIAELLETLEKDFRGDTDDNYECSMHQINIRGIKHQDKLVILRPEYFYPYNHQKDELKITENTICIHLFNKSWITEVPTTETIDIIIPHLGANREQGLRDLIDSIGKLNYPMDLVSIRIMDGEDSVPNKVKKGVGLSKSKYIVFAANDMTFDKECIRNAIECSKEYNKSLVSFNEGFLLPDEGNICTHFLIKRGFLPLLENGEIFSTDFNHVGCDNYLWAQASKLGESIWCENARITHNHFSKTNNFDDTYAKGWSKAEQDRITLKEKLAKLAST